MKTILLLTSFLAAMPVMAAYPGTPFHSVDLAMRKRDHVRPPDASACYSVTDADARAYCMARAHQDASRCYSIQHQSVRAMCISEVRK